MTEPKKFEQSEQNERGHEVRDTNVRAVTYFAIGLGSLLIIVFALMAGLFHWFAKEKIEAQPLPSPFAMQPESQPLPPLQITPETDYQTFRAYQDSLINSYGWIIKETGTVRIPIDRAIDLLAQRGLPATSDSAAGGSSGGENEGHSSKTPMPTKPNEKDKMK